MALKLQASFSTGELDPALRERITLQKYNSGLATARNVMVGKTGRLSSRPARKHLAAAKISDRRCILYSPPKSGLLLEWGHEYVRVYADAFSTGVWSLAYDVAHDFTEADLDSIQFETTNVDVRISTVYIFCAGKVLKVLDVGGSGCTFRTAADIFAIPAAPTFVSNTVGGTGYDVDYAITAVKDGQESAVLYTATGKIPISSGEINTIIASLGSSINVYTEMRVYRRPRSGGAYGFVGSTSSIATVSGAKEGTFVDVGGAADYSHSPPAPVTTFNFLSATDARALGSPTGTIYQQRLLLGDFVNKESIVASRTGFKNNFTRDYPLGADSALLFKAGTSGTARVLRMMDSDGLVVFTTLGVYLSTGALSPTNLTLDRKGNWVIDTRVPPIGLPGGVLFVDDSTNSIRHLRWSQENGAYVGDEISIYSNHLFIKKRIVSWAFQEGDTPVLFVVYNDGTYSTLTYDRDQEMRSWTRHDATGDVNVEYVCGSGDSNKTWFLVEKDGVRYIEYTIDRYVSAETAEADSESALNESNTIMDSMVSWKSLMNDDLDTGESFVLTPVVSDDWEGELTLTCGTTSNIFTDPGDGEVGEIFRFFNPVTFEATDLEVTARTSDDQVTVQPSNEFPSEYATGLRLYRTKATFTGLGHMEGEYPSVMVDGYVVCSPNNDIENYTPAQVVSGSLVLPDSMIGAIVHIGRPVTSDVETLDIDSVEQRPVFIESKVLNKLYVKVQDTRGLYVGNNFPDDDKVEGMEDLDNVEIGEEDGADLGNSYIPPYTRRIEKTLPGEWESQGRVCIRQVDPLPFEILSIMPDLEDQRR